MSETKTKLLFICTANVRRSRTAEGLFKNSGKYEVQSAGFMRHSLGRQVVTQELINWADRVFVMDERNDRHLTYLRDNFSIQNKMVHVLDVLDIYSKDSPTLIELLKSKLASLGILT